MDWQKQYITPQVRRENKRAERRRSFLALLCSLRQYYNNKLANASLLDEKRVLRTRRSWILSRIRALSSNTTQCNKIKKSRYTVPINEDVLEALKTLQVVSLNAYFIVRVTEQLEDDVFWQVREVLEFLGGNWSKQDTGLVFPFDPQMGIETLLEAGLLVTQEGGFRPPLETRANKRVSSSRAVKYDKNVLQVLKQMQVEPQNDHFVGRLTSKLDPKLYSKVDNALKAMGGKWRRGEGYTFLTDPRKKLNGLVNTSEEVVNQHPEKVSEGSIKKSETGVYISPVNIEKPL